MNILYLMFDQLRFDYLSCAGHPSLKTPNIDRIARGGVRFTNAYTQSPVCCPARMSAYTGRYVSSHGAQWNNHPLRIGEPTMGDHLRAAGMDCWLVGKTHMNADHAGMARLGISPTSTVGRRQAECGFDVWRRDDGLWGEGPGGVYDSSPGAYNAYLATRGYPGGNPWLDFASSGCTEGGIASGWFMKNAALPANIAEEDSETPWLTSEAIAFIEQAEGPWCAHVSYIKPHWPYIVPAPYHDMYGPEDVIPVVRDAAELTDPNPVYEAFTQLRVGQAFSRDAVRAAVIPAYMGLIRQCDDQLGRLFAFLEDSGRMDDTMIVIASDHGDYLGDHWMGEKHLFHAPSAKVPLIICDPRVDADATRGTTCDAPVELIDVTATIIEAAGGAVPAHIVEGRSLMPYLRGEQPARPRDYAISEYDFSGLAVRSRLGLSPQDSRLVMVATEDWKMVHCHAGLPPMLFDLKNDPDELIDLGRDPGHAGTRAELRDMMLDWALRPAQRITISDHEIDIACARAETTGILLGLYDGSEVDPALSARYRGPAPNRPAR